MSRKKNSSAIPNNASTHAAESKKTSRPRLGKIRRADPFFARECEKYEFPLPSREYIAQILAQEGIPLSFETLVDRLDIHPHELAYFQRRLHAMERDGQLLRNRRNDYLLPDKVSLIKGTIQGHPDGFGFLIRDDGEGDDIFLSPHAMREVLHGDRVLARITGTDRRGRPEGKIVEILERGQNRVVGRVRIEHGVAIVVPEDRRVAQDIVLAPGGKKVTDGKVVTVELIRQPGRDTRPVGKVIEVLGNYADPGMEIEIALRKHDLPFVFTDEARQQARKLPTRVRKLDMAGREDLTQLPLVTIDGETAKDFDDAVYCERSGRGYRLIVAIADVSHYVTPGSPLDQDAYQRGNSVYFPRRVIPMLPEKLSNGLCSLVPRENRLCMACDMQITPTGQIRSYRFYPAVMHSHARLTYNQVAAALYQNDDGARAELAPLLPHLEQLDTVFRALLKARHQRGAIDFETTETRMIFNDDDKIERIVPEERNDAHRLIEEAMLAANVCAARYLLAHTQPALYRIHEGPTPEKLEKLRASLREFGLTLGGGEDPAAPDYNHLLQTCRTRPDYPLLQTMLLRSLRQALYSPENVGHFGLAYDAYTHFTSPIRRYPDLLIHRAIKATLAGERLPFAQLETIGQHCSATERRADEATRDVTAWLKCHFMHDRIGETFTGSVSTVVPFGLFVMLDDLYVEGLIHISDLGADYFHHDETRHELKGERTGTRYRMGDRLRVQLVRVDLESNKIDFRLLEALPPEAPQSTQPAQPKAKLKTPKAAKLAKAVKAGKPAPAEKPKKTAKAAAPKAKSTKAAKTTKATKSAKTAITKPAKTAKTAKTTKPTKPKTAAAPAKKTTKAVPALLRSKKPIES